jgi:tetratricopeptide (TPR) repeat protein
VGGKTGVALVLGILVALCAARASAGPDPRELTAREDFAAGRYQEALDLFARLYAESLHPNYLRNIGRCYQNLGQPDRAINSFRDYLRKAKGLSDDERQEIDGYIKEMEDLKRQREGSPPPERAATASAPVAPLPASGSAPAVEVVVAAPAASSAPAEETPVYERWWFWTLIGGAVAIGLGAAAVAGVFTHTQDASCPMGIKCQ